MSKPNLDTSWVALGATWDRLTAEWDGPTDSDGAPCYFVNHYRCEPCGEEWEDQWSCACNDECPSCGKEIEPHDSDYLGPAEE